MPVYLRPNELFVKNPNGAGYLPQNVISQNSTSEILEAFDQTVANTRESLNTMTSAAQQAVDGIESQKNTMIASIASVAGQGTDTTLTQSGVAADAKTVGNEIGDLNTAVQIVEDEKADAICKTIGTSSDIMTFEDGADDLPVEEMKIAIEHAQNGTGDPSPENVRPISGWTGCNVTRTGKNLVDITSIIAQYYSIVDGEVRCSRNFTSNGRMYLQPIQLQAGTYTFSLKWHTTSTHDNPNITTSVVNADSNTDILAANNKAFVDTGDGYGVVNRTFTLTETTQIKFSVQATNANSQTLSFKDFQLEVGSEATKYAPFVATYSITFPSQAGTVYGGNLIIHADGTGELVVDRMVFEFDGSSDEVWNRYTSGGDNYYFGFQHSGTECFKNNSEELPLSNELIAASIAIGTQNIGIGIVNHRDFRIRYELNNDLSVDDLRSWLSQHPLQILAWLYGEAYYKHFYFSAPQVRTLLGLNHIWADTGHINSIKYPVGGDYIYGDMANNISNAMSYKNIDERLKSLFKLHKTHGGNGTYGNHNQRNAIVTPQHYKFPIRISVNPDYRFAVQYYDGYEIGPSHLIVSNAWVYADTSPFEIEAGRYWCIIVSKTDNSVTDETTHTNLRFEASANFDDVYSKLMPLIDSRDKEASGYCVGQNLAKHPIFAKKLGLVKYYQSWCLYDGHYYSTNGTKICKQSLDFTEVSDVSISVGHGNSFQIGTSNLAYISGWNDQKVYVVDLDTISVVSTINLPTTGYTTCAVDDNRKLVYIFQRDSNPSTEEYYNFIVYDYDNEQIVSTSKTSVKFAAMQACDLIDDRIFVINGLGTAEAPNYYRVFDLNGNVVGQYFFPGFAKTEPEGVFIDRNTKELTIGLDGRTLYSIAFDANA